MPLINLLFLGILMLRRYLHLLEFLYFKPLYDFGIRMLVKQFMDA